MDKVEPRITALTSRMSEMQRYIDKYHIEITEDKEKWKKHHEIDKPKKKKNKEESDSNTRNILHALYKYVGLKGSFKAWVDKFKRGYKLDLITENEIKELVKRITISLKRYKNN